MRRAAIPFRPTPSPIFLLTPGMLLRSAAFRSLVRSPRRLEKERNRLLCRPKHPGALFVALSKAKSAGGEGVDTDFAFTRMSCLMTIDSILRTLPLPGQEQSKWKDCMF